MHATHGNDCGSQLHPECAERIASLEVRQEAVEDGQSEIRSLLVRVAEDAAYTRGRIDSIATPPQPPPKRKRRAGIILNLGLGAGIVTLIDYLKDLAK